MKNRRIFAVFLIAATATAGSVSDSTTSAGSMPSVTDSVMADMSRKALSNPFIFYRTGKLPDLLRLIEARPEAGHGIPADSLTSLFDTTEKRSNPYLRLMAGTLLYAALRENPENKGCQYLLDAGNTAFDALKDIRLTRLFLEYSGRAGCIGTDEAVSRVDSWQKNDAQIDSLLKAPQRYETDSSRLMYVSILETALVQHPHTSLKKDVFKRIGDVYFGMKEHRRMTAWYKKAVRLDSAMKKSTPIGYRLERAAKHILIANMRIGAWCVYAALLALLLARAVRNPHSFRPGLFARQACLYLAVYALLAVLVFSIDGLTTGKAAIPLAKQPEYRGIMVIPVVPLSIMDSTNLKQAAVLLSIGFLPLLFVALYTSFIRPYSRMLLLLAVLIGAPALWTHFYVNSAFDGLLNQLGHKVGWRLYYNGELEKIMMADPAKVLRANPDLLDNNNTDLRLFIQKEFPGGLPKTD